MDTEYLRKIMIIIHREDEDDGGDLVELNQKQELNEGGDGVRQPRWSARKKG